MVKCGCVPCPVGAGPVLLVLALSYELWSSPICYSPALQLLSPSHGCCPCPMGAGPILLVLALSHRCWLRVGPRGAHQGTSRRVLGILEKGQDPTLQHSPGRTPVFPGDEKGGSRLGTAQAQVSPRPPRARVVAGGARGHAYRNRFPLSAILVLLSTPALSRLLNWKFRHREGGGSAFLLTGWQRPPALCIPQGGGTLVLTFSSFSPSAAGVQLGQARSPLSWLELLLARCCRLPAGTWGTATR